MPPPPTKLAFSGTLCNRYRKFPRTDARQRARRARREGDDRERLTRTSYRRLADQRRVGHGRERKGDEASMKGQRRSILASAAAVLVGVAAIATTAASGGSTAQAAHPCVVATGSGDAAFIRNFNPFQAASQVARDFTAGGIYENLLISTAFGGGNIYNVLAQEAHDEQGRQDAHDCDPAQRQVVGRLATYGRRRRLQPQHRQAEQVRRSHRAHVADDEHRLDQGLGRGIRSRSASRLRTRRSSGRSSRTSGSSPRRSGRRSTSRSSRTRTPSARGRSRR